MAKDFAEIKQRVEFYIDDTMNPDTLLMLINQCSEDISYIAAYARTVDAEFDRDVPTISLPLDFLESIELKIKRTGETDYLRILPIGLVQPPDTLTSLYTTDTDSSTGYEIFGNAIEIRSSTPSSGQLLLRYYATLPLAAALTDVSPLKARFHDMYALYAAAKYFQNYKDELQAKQDFWGEYLSKRAELEQEYHRIKTRSLSKTVYQFRRWS